MTLWLVRQNLRASVHGLIPLYLFRGTELISILNLIIASMTIGEAIEPVGFELEFNIWLASPKTCLTTLNRF
ncbi:hypothetical protein PCC7424_5634 (plasmid) [Gloeothece citriformis PCC 7424]|uniref:Uncharacterized protein n=1 Tax=Gloeothece citriformis (strain PCC 7424) TaxID=65393 RepID=B7KLN8_GLOC7|nr:hypothetical protein PCC7424_5634 [Gloeothece citriformis PCC 7424]